MRARRLQQIGNDVIDAGDFLANVFDYGPGWAGRGKIAADDLDHAGDPGQRVTNFMGQACGDFA